MTVKIAPAAPNFLRSVPSCREIFPRDLPETIDRFISRHALEAAQRLSPSLQGLGPGQRHTLIAAAACRLWESIRGESVIVGDLPPQRFDIYVHADARFAGVATDRLERLLMALVDVGSLRKTLLRERERIDAALAALPEVDG